MVWDQHQDEMAMTLPAPVTTFGLHHEIAQVTVQWMVEANVERRLPAPLGVMDLVLVWAGWDMAIPMLWEEALVHG
jgi:hypothetical protein